MSVADATHGAIKRLWLDGPLDEDAPYGNNFDDNIAIMAAAATVGIERAIFDLWLDAIQHAYLLAKSQRLAEIRADRRTKRFDQRGLHPVSVEWGKVFACEQLLPGLTELRDVGGEGCDPITLDRLAQDDARVAFTAEIREQGDDAWRV